MGGGQGGKEDCSRDGSLAAGLGNFYFASFGGNVIFFFLLKKKMEKRELKVWGDLRSMQSRVGARQFSAPPLYGFLSRGPGRRLPGSQRR